jgi:hypothetical protein
MQSRALLQPGASSMRCKAYAWAYSDGPAFDLPQDSPRIAPETPFARERRLCRRPPARGRHGNADGPEIRAREGGLRFLGGLRALVKAGVARAP